MSAAEGQYSVAQELGFHLRPAGRFVRLASQFDAEIEVSIRDEEWVSVTNMSYPSGLSLSSINSKSTPVIFFG